MPDVEAPQVRAEAPVTTPPRASVVGIKLTEARLSQSPYNSADRSPTQQAYTASPPAGNDHLPSTVHRLVLTPDNHVGDQGQVIPRWPVPATKISDSDAVIPEPNTPYRQVDPNRQPRIPPLVEPSWIDGILAAGCHYVAGKVKDPEVDEGGDILTTALKKLLEGTVGRLVSIEEVKNEQGKLALKLAAYIDEKFEKDWDRAFDAYSVEECATGDQQKVVFFHGGFTRLLKEAQYKGPTMSSGEHVAKLMLSPGSNAATREEFKALQNYRDQDRAYVHGQLATKVVPYLAASRKVEGNWHHAFLRYAAADHSTGTTKLELLESGLEKLFRDAGCNDLLSIPERRSQLMGDAKALSYIDFVTLLAGGPEASAPPPPKASKPSRKKRKNNRR